MFDFATQPHYRLKQVGQVHSAHGGCQVTLEEITGGEGWTRPPCDHFEFAQSPQKRVYYAISLRTRWLQEVPHIDAACPCPRGSRAFLLWKLCARSASIIKTCMRYMRMIWCRFSLDSQMTRVDKKVVSSPPNRHNSTMIK